MKKKSIFSVCLILLALGLALASCSNGSTSNDAVDDSLLFYGTSDGKAVTVEISQTDPSKAVLTVKGGEFYVIKWAADVISRGKISVTNNTWLFTPSSGSPGTKTSFSATYSNGVLSFSSIPGTDISNLTVSVNGNNNTTGDGDGNGNGKGNSTGSGTGTGTGTGAGTGTTALTGTVTIDNTSPQVGDTLTATYTLGNGSGTPTWQWLRDDTAIANTNGNTYIVTVADEGKTLKAQISYADKSGSVTSATTTAVPVDPRPTLTGASVTIDNTSPVIGDLLTASYIAGNGNGTVTWQWLRDDNNISSANNDTYTVTSADVGSKLKAQIRFADNKGEATSSATGTVLSGPATVYVDGGGMTNEGFADLKSALDSITAAGTYTVKIASDQSLDSYSFGSSVASVASVTLIAVSGPVEILLENNSSSLFLLGVLNNISLTLDSGITLRGLSGNNEPLVRVGNGGSLIMKTGSKITGNKQNNYSSSGNGGGVEVYRGTFTMLGGEIFENDAFSGGGVTVHADGIFTMEDGKIYQNTAAVGAGVEMSGVDGEFIMNGGEIFGNTAIGGGGGVYVDIGTFTMLGGEIFRNIVNNAGGGVCVGSFATFKKESTGGIIKGYDSADADSNVVKDTSDNVQIMRGHAVFIDSTYKRETTVISGEELKWEGGIPTGYWD